MLNKIIENKILEVQKLKNQLDYSVNDVIEMNLPKNSFIKSIQNNIKSGKNAIIAELKRCSPSKGYLNKELDIKGMASLYEDSGAACIFQRKPYAKDFMPKQMRRGAKRNAQRVQEKQQGHV